jgi:hypothetical protein
MSMGQGTRSRLVRRDVLELQTPQFYFAPGDTNVSTGPSKNETPASGRSNGRRGRPVDPRRGCDRSDLECHSRELGTASDWTPATIPNSSSATASFNAATGSSPDVSLAGAPFTVGTLDLNNDVSGGFTFQNGTLQLAGPATINVESHNLAPDVDTTATIALQAEATINTSSFHP